MNQGRYQLLKKLVGQALELPERERDAFLQEHCEDTELLSEARDLLLHYRPDDEEGKGDLVKPLDLPDMTGKIMGRYQVIEPIGEGGMGVVYLAAQSAPLRRKVALKVIKLGMDTREVITRFESERQALALMDHPNIAKVLDAGATEEGRPFFVMEYIPGVPLNKYCDDHDLGLRARLDLFIKVCRGVQHAHQKGVIHRDLKPGNILVAEVEGRPVPKIIDFGVAKATGQHLAAQTMFTQMGQMIGTPEYMSPEQAGTSMQDVDTRSDVYSLGVLLYELLTGFLPLERGEIMRAGLERMALHVQNEIPKKPSTRIDTEAKTDTASKSDFDKATPLWVKRVRGDLDWITMKALEKERDRRYGSPEDLAEDLERHLNNHPVQAGPPSGFYRVRKFIKRNRIGVAVSVLFLAALLAGTIGTSIGLVRAKRAESDALVAADRAEATTLYQLAKSEEVPAFSLPYIMAALERDDRMEYRLFAKKLLLESPPHWRLPKPPDSHNPYAIDISPDGAWMAVGWAKNGYLQLYSLDGGEPVLLSGHRGRVTRVRFSEDSRYLITTAKDSTVILWSPKKAEMIREWRFPGEVKPYLDIAQNRYITQELVLGESFRWRAWPLDGGPATDLGSVGPPLISPFVLENSLGDLDPSRRWVVQPDGNRLDLYDLTNLASGPVRTIGVHEGETFNVEISPTGKTVASFDHTGRVLIWDLDASTSGPLRELQANRRPLFIRFDQKGKRLAVSGIGGLKIWDLSQSEAIKPLELKYRNWSFTGAFHPTENWIVTTGTGSLLAAWPLVNQQPVILDFSNNGVGAMKFSPDGRHLIIGIWDGVIWDIPLVGKRIGEPKILHYQEEFDFAEIHIDDASQLAFVSTCNSVRGNGTILRIPLGGGKVQLFEGFTCSFVLDGSGRYIAASADQGFGIPFVKLFDTETGEDRMLDESMGGFTLASGFTRDGRLLVSGPAGVGFWDNIQEKFTLVAEGMKSGWLSEDRQTIVLFSPENDIWRRKMDSSDLEKLPLKFKSEELFIFQGDSTGSCLAGGFWGGAVQILDMDAQKIYEFIQPESLVSVVALDPQKRWIATSGHDGQGVVKLMPLPRGIPLEALPYEELMRKLHALTNLRVAQDDEAEFGFAVVGRGVPDWKNPPTW